MIRCLKQDFDFPPSSQNTDIEHIAIIKDGCLIVQCLLITLMMFLYKVLENCVHDEGVIRRRKSKV